MEPTISDTHCCSEFASDLPRATPKDAATATSMETTAAAMTVLIVSNMFSGSL